MAGRHKKNLAQRCAFEECLRQHEGLTLQCLPPAARFHYTLSRNDQDLVLPITLRTPESSRVRCKYLDSVQQGVIVCWFGLEKIVLIQAPTQLKKVALSCVQRDGLETQTVSQLAQGLKGLLDNTAQLARPEDLANDLSYNRGQGSHAIEARFTNWLTQHSAGGFTKSFEGCLCDGWLSRDNRPEVLPIQLKASARSPTCGDFAFSCKKLYPTMLVMLRHVIADKGTFVSPGALLPATGVCGTWKGKFSRFLVPDDRLMEFLGDLFQAVARAEKTLTWPSGGTVDISALTLQSRVTLNTPTMAIKQKEQQFCMLRAQLLPGLVYRNTEREAETVDIYINGRGVQDKTASVSGRMSLQFNVHKHLGQGKKGPYEVGDFEFLWVNLPDLKRFYLISSKELECREILKSESAPGKQTICVYPDGSDHCADLWCNAYLFSYRDSDIEAKVASALCD